MGSVRPFTAEFIWKARAEPKVVFFSWTAMHDKLLTADNLAKRGWQHNPYCPLCFLAQESTNHLLTSCFFAKQVIAYIMSWFKVAGG